MELTGRVRIVEDAGFGVWKVDAAPKDLQFLGKPLAREDGRSIIALGQYELSEDKETLVFPINSVSVLSLGNSKDCIAVAIQPEEVLGYQSTEEEMETIETKASTRSAEQDFRIGDPAFISACRSEALPQSIVQLGEIFLNQVREFSEDELREGLHRKWVTYPKNFLALTIQNRNKQFCVHVKKTPALESLRDTLDIRDDRPGYVRFWLQNDSQLNAAVKAAKSSFSV